MKVEFIKKFEKSGDFITLVYKIDDDTIKVNIGGTALGVLDIPEDEAGLSFEPAVTDIYVRCHEQGVLTKEINVDSEGAKIKGKIVYLMDKMKNILKK